MSKPRQPPRRLVLENTFDAYVRHSGNEVVADLLLPKPTQPPKAADYLLFGRAVIAELKCLQEDYFTAAGVGEKLKKLRESWVQDGLLPSRPGTFSTENLPFECQRDAAAVFAQPLDAALKDANLQIKATRTLFGLPDAKGLLILANDGNYSLPPKLTMQLLGYRLRNRFSAIQSVVYFAPGMEVTGVEGAQRFWISGPAKESDDGVPPELLRELSRGWAEFNGCTVTVTADHSMMDKLGFAAVESRGSRSQSTYTSDGESASADGAKGTGARGSGRAG